MADTIEIGRSKDIKRIIQQLNEQHGEFEEIVVLAKMRNEEGQSVIRWWFSPIISRFQTAGALQWMQTRILGAQE